MLPQFLATIPGVPATITAQQKGVNFQARSHRKRFYTKPEVRREERRLAAHLPNRPHRPMDGPLICQLTFIHPLTKQLARKHAEHLSDPNFTLPHPEKPDADNCAKLLLDVLTKCRVWRDDKQVCDLVLRKRYGSYPRIEIEIRPFGA